MRKLLSVVLALTMIVCLFLGGCGQKKPEETTVETTAATDTEVSSENAAERKLIPEAYSVRKADTHRMVEADGIQSADQEDFWCVVEKHYRNDENEKAGTELLNDPQKVLEDAGMRYPEQWAVKVLADVYMEGDTDKYNGGSVTLRFPESNGKSRICAMGYINGQWVRGEIAKATNDYADARFDTLPDLAVLFYKSEGEGFRSPNGGSYIGEDGRILEVMDWPFELQDEYWCVIDQEYQSEADEEAVRKLMEDPAAHIADFVESDGSNWKLVLVVDVRLEGNLDKYDGSPITVAFPEVRANQEVLVLHFTNGEWHEEHDKYVVDDYIGVRFTSLSPVAFFVLDK